MSFRSCSILALLVALLVALGVACASESYQKVPRPDLSVDVPGPGLVRVYVVRDDQVRGSVRSIDVYEDQEQIGSLGLDDYLCWERLPGRTLVKFVYNGPAIDGGKHEGLLDLPLAAGEVGYCIIHLDSRGKPMAKLHPRADAVGLLETRTPAPVN